MTKTLTTTLVAGLALLGLPAYGGDKPVKDFESNYQQLLEKLYDEDYEAYKDLYGAVLNLPKDLRFKRDKETNLMITERRDLVTYLVHNSDNIGELRGYLNLTRYKERTEKEQQICAYYHALAKRFYFANPPKYYLELISVYVVNPKKFHEIYEYILTLPVKKGNKTIFADVIANECRVFIPFPTKGEDLSLMVDMAYFSKSKKR